MLYVNFDILNFFIFVKQFQVTNNEIESLSYLKKKYFEWKLSTPIENHEQPEVLVSQ